MEAATSQRLLMMIRRNVIAACILLIVWIVADAGFILLGQPYSAMWNSKIFGSLFVMLPFAAFLFVNWRAFSKDALLRRMISSSAAALMMTMVWYPTAAAIVYFAHFLLGGRE